MKSSSPSDGSRRDPVTGTRSTSLSQEIKESNGTPNRVSGLYTRRRHTTPITRFRVPNDEEYARPPQATNTKPSPALPRLNSPRGPWYSPITWDHHHPPNARSNAIPTHPQPHKTWAPRHPAYPPPAHHKPTPTPHEALSPHPHPNLDAPKLPPPTTPHPPPHQLTPKPTNPSSPQPHQTFPPPTSHPPPNHPPHPHPKRGPGWCRASPPLQGVLPRFSPRRPLRRGVPARGPRLLTTIHARAPPPPPPPLPPPRLPHLSRPPPPPTPTSTSTHTPQEHAAAPGPKIPIPHQSPTGVRGGRRGGQWVFRATDYDGGVRGVPVSQST